jgi:hypothetical protein
VFAVSSIRPVRPVSAGCWRSPVLGMLLASLLPVANATPFAPRPPSRATRGPASVTIAATSSRSSAVQPTGAPTAR